MRIYIVDNSMMTWAWLLNIISQINGLEITGFTGNTQKAIDTIKKLQPDLVFLNHQLFNKNGINLIKKIKHISHNSKVVILGEDTPPDNKDICLNAGADYYFDKIKDNRKNSNALLQIVHEI
jgi:two-component SAPR family response regulator